MCNLITVLNIFRLLDPGKAEIIQKSTQLTKDIRLYNSIVKYKDIPEEIDDPTSIKSVQSEKEPPPDLDQHSEHEPSLQTDPSLQTEPSLQTAPSLQTEPAITEQSSQPSKLPHPEKEISTKIEQEPQQRLESGDVTPSEHVSFATEEDAVRTKIQLDVDVRGFQIYYFKLIISTCPIYLSLLPINYANPILTNRLSLLTDPSTEWRDVALL